MPTAPITWAGPHGELAGAWAEAPNARGGVLVIHENKGLNDWVRSVAGRFAGIGYSALAIDLLSAQGGTAKFADPAEATAALGNIADEEFVGESEVRCRRAAAAGARQEGRGGRVLHGRRTGLATARRRGRRNWRPRCRSTVRLPTTPDFAGSKDAAVLGFYGALDDRVNKTEPAAKAALEKAGLVHELVTEPDANHAFFNDTSDRYNATAAAGRLASSPGLVRPLPGLTRGNAVHEALSHRSTAASSVGTDVPVLIRACA